MKNICRLRQERGLPLRKLARKAGLHWTTIWKIEKAGRIPNLVTLNKLAKAYRDSQRKSTTGASWPRRQPLTLDNPSQKVAGL
jgi:transcriptional regulator with XRE-family HTH domain